MQVKPDHTHYWQLAIIVVVGLVAAMTDPWARENSEAYLEGFQWFMLIALFFGILFQRSSGALKSRPDRLKMSDVTKRVPAVGSLLLGYFLLLGVLAVSTFFLPLQLDDHIASPLAGYLVLLPFALILVWGKYKMLQDMQSDGKEK